MLRLITLFCMAAAGVFATFTVAPSAKAQTAVNYFYCFGVDASQGTIFISDVQKVGPIGERAGYGGQFRSYLRGKGVASDTVRAYCLMRATQAEIQLGQHELRESGCRMCNDIANFENVVWMRDPNSGAEKLLEGTLIKPSVFDTAELGKDGGHAPPPKEQDEELGVYIVGSREQNDLVYSINEVNGGTKARLSADLKGGKWTTIAHDNRCPGWMAVAYASDGTSRHYYLAQGADSEGEASLQALEKAEEAVKRQDGNWTTGVLVAFRNNYKSKGPSVSDVAAAVAEGEVVNALKGVVREMVATDKSLGCPRTPGPFERRDGGGNATGKRG